MVLTRVWVWDGCDEFPVLMSASEIWLSFWGDYRGSIVYEQKNIQS